MMVNNQQNIILCEADETVIEAISKLNADSDDMTHYLSSLSPNQIALLTSDTKALQSLQSSILAITKLPVRFYAARFEDGELIGYVSVRGYNQAIPEIGIEVAPSFQRQGYGRKILDRALHIVVEDMNARSVFYRTRPDNTASIRLAESFGGVLQAPSSPAEEILLKTYLIKADLT